MDSLRFLQYSTVHARVHCSLCPQRDWRSSSLAKERQHFVQRRIARSDPQLTLGCLSQNDGDVCVTSWPEAERDLASTSTVVQSHCCWRFVNRLDLVLTAYSDRELVHTYNSKENQQPPFAHTKSHRHRTMATATARATALRWWGLVGDSTGIITVESPTRPHQRRAGRHRARAHAAAASKSTGFLAHRVTEKQTGECRASQSAIEWAASCFCVRGFRT